MISYLRIIDNKKTPCGSNIHNSLPSLLKPKLILRHPSHPNINPKQPTPVPHRLRQLLIITIILSRSNKQLRPHKRRTRRVPRRQINLPDNLALGRNPYHLTAPIDSTPQATLNINGKTIRLQGVADIKVHAAVADGPGGGVEVKGKDLPGRRVGEVHGVVGGVPADSVGDRDWGQHLVQGEVGVEAEEGALGLRRLDLGVVHGAGPEAAVAVDRAIVEAHPVARMAVSAGVWERAVKLVLEWTVVVAGLGVWLWLLLLNMQTYKYCLASSFSQGWAI